MTEAETRVVAAWREAATDLGFQFTSPFIIALQDGPPHEHLGLVHRFGRRVGALITVLDQPSEKFPAPAGDDYFWSILSPDYARYERQLFIDTLEDWQFFGPAAERPAWYSGKTWR